MVSCQFLNVLNCEQVHNHIPYRLVCYFCRQTLVTWWQLTNKPTSGLDISWSNNLPTRQLVD